MITTKIRDRETRDLVCDFLMPSPDTELKKKSEKLPIEVDWNFIHDIVDTIERLPHPVPEKGFGVEIKTLDVKVFDGLKNISAKEVLEKKDYAYEVCDIYLSRRDSQSSKIETTLNALIRFIKFFNTSKLGKDTKEHIDMRNEVYEYISKLKNVKILAEIYGYKCERDLDEMLKEMLEGEHSKAWFTFKGKEGVKPLHECTDVTRIDDEEILNFYHSLDWLGAVYRILMNVSTFNDRSEDMRERMLDAFGVAQPSLIFNRLVEYAKYLKAEGKI